MNLDAAEKQLADALAAREAAELALKKFRTGKLEISPERIAARNAVWDAQKVVTTARQAVRKATWLAMLKETEELLPRLRAEYQAAEREWLSGDAIKPNHEAYTGQQYLRLTTARDALDEVQNPLNELRWQVEWAEKAASTYAAWLEKELDKDSLDYTEQREQRADRMEEKQRELDYRPPWEGLG